MKKIISLTMALIMALSCLGIGFSAQAADAANCVNITLKGTAYDSTVQSYVSRINTDRNAAGYTEITLDKTLVEIAKKRALETMLYLDSNDEYRPNGDTVKSFIPSQYGNAGNGAALIDGTDVDTVYNRLKDLLYYPLSDDYYSSFVSMGLAVVKYSDVSALYIIISQEPASQEYTGNTNSSFSHTVEMDLKNAAKTNVYGSDDKKYVRANLVTQIVGKGFCNKAFTVPNSQVTYSSSNASVMKVKGAIGYPKKNGKFTIYAKTKSGKLIAKNEYSINTFSSVKVTLKSLKSKKKKTMTASWTKNVVDASGYQIQYSTNSKFKKGNKAVTVKGKKNGSATIKNLKRKKVYYVRVRVYVDQGNGEKAYSKWSNVKKVKVK